MGNHTSTPKSSYHITKDFGNNNHIIYWPLSGFGQYCDDLKTAEKQFDEYVKDDPTKTFKIVKYESVLHNGKVVGITGDSELIKEYNPNKC